MLHTKVLARSSVVAALLTALACQRASDAEFDDSRLPSAGDGASSGGAKPSGGTPSSVGAQPNAGEGPGSTGAGGAMTDGGSPGGAGDGETGGSAAGGTGGVGTAGTSTGGKTGGGGMGGEAGGSSGSGGKPADPDPITVTITDLADTYVASCTLQLFGYAKTLIVDRDFGCRYAALINPSLAMLPMGAEVVSAKLELTCTNAGDPIAVAYAEGSWAEATARWQNKPKASSSLRTFTCEAPGRLSVDLTASVAAWVSGQRPAYGIYLDSTGDNGTKFVSSEAEDAADRPALVVTYEQRP